MYFRYVNGARGRMREKEERNSEGCQNESISMFSFSDTAVGVVGNLLKTQLGRVRSAKRVWGKKKKKKSESRG